MIAKNVEQNSPEWYQLKCGTPSSSNFDKIITTKGEPSKQRDKYLYQLAGERLTGTKEETFKNEAMEIGIERENEAANIYELIKGVELEKVGVCYKDEDKRFLASPDRLTEDGLIEIKCPLIHTHVEYLLNNKLPTKYFQQVQGQLFITEKKWCDFVSYYPGLKPLLVRVEPDLAFHAKLEKELNTFCDELDRIVERIK